MSSFRNSFYDDTDLWELGYYTSKKGYCMMVVLINGKKKCTKRISEQEYIRAYELHINA